MAEARPEDFVNTPGPFDIVTHEERYPPRGKILNNVLEAVGNTPLIRLNKIPQSYGVNCEILAKCEYFNPGGSIKDRIAMRMVNDAVKNGRLEKGGHLIEPSSGNTGVSLGLVCSVQGFKGTVTVADKNDGDKLVVMNALGLDIVKTPSSVKFDDPRSYFSVAYEMSKNTPNAVTLNQYECISNALANYDQTAEEILEQCDNKVDAIVIATGTGGTLTGIAAKIKQKLPSCKIIGVDPYGSIMAEPASLNNGVHSYKIEGMGHDFVPNTCVRKYVDQWIKTSDKESFDIARRMIKEEGMLTGGSCGSVVYAAIKYALDNKVDKDHRIVVVLPDAVRNYITKYASDDWMVDFGFWPLSHYEKADHKLHGKTVKELKLTQVKTYKKAELTVQEALKLLEGGQEIIIEDGGKVAGVIVERNLLETFNLRGLSGSDDLSQVNVKPLPTVELSTDLSIVSKLLERHKVVLVQEKGANDQLTVHKITPLSLLSAGI